MTRTSAAVAAIALAMSGCGSRVHKAATGTTTTVTATTSTIAGAKASGSGSATTTTTTTTAKVGANGATATTAMSGTTSSTMSNVITASSTTAKLDRACVHPGESQGFTVTVSPEDDLVYDTVYSDRSSGFGTKYESGHGTGKADTNGVFRATWAVPSNAPAGPATVDVVDSTQGREVVRATFTIKPATQPC